MKYYMALEEERLVNFNNAFGVLSSEILNCETKHNIYIILNASKIHLLSL